MAGGFGALHGVDGRSSIVIVLVDEGELSAGVVVRMRSAARGAHHVFSFAYDITAVVARVTTWEVIGKTKNNDANKGKG